MGIDLGCWGGPQTHKRKVTFLLDPPLRPAAMEEYLANMRTLRSYMNGPSREPTAPSPVPAPAALTLQPPRLSMVASLLLQMMIRLLLSFLPMRRRLFISYVKLCLLWQLKPDELVVYYFAVRTSLVMYVDLCLVIVWRVKHDDIVV